MSLTSAQRKSLPDSDFAVPSKRALPIVDERHVRMAWSQVDRTQGLSEEERAEAKRRIVAKAKALGLDTADWEMKAAGEGGLYVRRNLTADSAAALTEWALGQGFTNLTPVEEMHATIVYSRQPVAIDPLGGNATADQDGRAVAPLGDRGAVVLHISAPELEARWQAAMEAGASWDWDGFQAHVTITYDGAGIDLANIEPYAGDLVFGPEIHEPFNENWAEEKGYRMQASGVRFEGESLAAMALAMPEVYGHPNRMPFSGILSRLDSPSDKAPHGSKGKRVIFTKAAAERALPSLLGMGVGLTDSFDGHDPTRKIGVITAASIEGDAIHVDGFIYARDFPAEASRIQTDKDRLGFSWELADIYVESLAADPLVITDASFTGAAILRKDKAAFSSTSLAASAEDPEMTKEEMQAVLDAALKPVTDTIASLSAAHEATEKKLTEMSAAAEKTAKEAVEAAAKAEAEKAGNEKISALETQIADLKAAADKAKVEPERKTLSPQISAMLAKADLAMPGADGKLDRSTVDAALNKAGLSPEKRLEVKTALTHAGALA